MQTGILGQGDKRRKASSNVVKLIKANQNDHGFVGWIGLVTGHPMLLNHQMASEQAVSRAGSTVTFEDFCAGLGGDVTLKAATEAWNKSRTAEITALAPATVSVTAPATVSVTSDEQSVSSISHQSSVSSISHQSSVSSTAMSTVSKKSTANAKKSTAKAKKLVRKHHQEHQRGGNAMRFQGPIHLVNRHVASPLALMQPNAGAVKVLMNFTGWTVGKRATCTFRT